MGLAFNFNYVACAYRVGRRGLVIAGISLLTFISSPIWAAEGAAFVDDPSAKKYALILLGASATEEHEQRFAKWGGDLRSILIKEYGYGERNVTLLAGDGGKNQHLKSDGVCRLDTLREVMAGLSSKLKAGDQLTIVMFGHGSGASEDAKFNIVGPDITGAQFAEMLAPIKTQNIVVVNTTSASHDFTRALSAPGRVLVSATRSRAEKYDTVFPQYFVAALRERASDRDKNRRVSVLEAFHYASGQAQGYFKEGGMLASEHAALDDNGDGVLNVVTNAKGDGRLAEVAYFDVLGAGNENLGPTAAKLKAQMANLEREVIMLRANKATLSNDAYWNQLETLLVQLAKTTREFNSHVNATTQP